MAKFTSFRDSLTSFLAAVVVGAIAAIPFCVLISLVYWCVQHLNG